MPDPPRQLLNFVPRAPTPNLEARVVSVYGSAVANVAQNQVVALNRGSKDAMEVGYVFAVLKDGQRLIDKTDEKRTAIKLPDERAGLLLVFRTFERVSYALVLRSSEAISVGDRAISPR